MRATASAPASSGNLGPGFDTLAIAFGIRCTVTAEAAAEWAIEEVGVVSPLEPDDLIARAAAAVADRPMLISVHNEIPRARGLGSSSAVAAAAAAAASRVAGIEPDPYRIFELVADLEGHGDNAAAAVFGGLVAVAGRRVARLSVAPSLAMVVAVPDSRLSTKRARSALPVEVPRPAVVRTLGRLAFLVEGLRTGDRVLLAAAAGDELHELPRAHLSPVTADLIAAAFAGGAMHAAWSGAGPAVLAVAARGDERRIGDAMREVLGDGGEVMVPAVDTDGLV